MRILVAVSILTLSGPVHAVKILPQSAPVSASADATAKMALEKRCMAIEREYQQVVARNGKRMADFKLALLPIKEKLDAEPREGTCRDLRTFVIHHIRGGTPAQRAEATTHDASTDVAEGSVEERVVKSIVGFPWWAKLFGRIGFALGVIFVVGRTLRWMLSTR